MKVQFGTSRRKHTVRRYDMTYQTVCVVTPAEDASTILLTPNGLHTTWRAEQMGWQHRQKHTRTHTGTHAHAHAHRGCWNPIYKQSGFWLKVLGSFPGVKYNIQRTVSEKLQPREACVRGVRSMCWFTLIGLAAHNRVLFTADAWVLVSA